MSKKGDETQAKQNYGPIAFIPLILFLALYLGTGIACMVMGIEEPFNQITSEDALLFGVIAAFFIGKHSFSYKLDVIAKAAGNPGIIMMCLIFLCSGAFVGVAKEMGGVESTVNLGLTFIPIQFIFAGLFIVSAFIATAMGTSMGTIAAIGPVAVSLAEKADINTALAIGAVVGGAMFGDNLSIISDTTIAATRGAGCKMNEKFKMNISIALPAALVATIIYSVLGTKGTLEATYSFELIKVLPYILVLVTAVMGINVIVVLLSGTFLAAIIGFFTNSMTITSFFASMQNGMSGMYSLVIVAILVGGITGIVKEYGGVDWLIDKLTKNIRGRKGGEFGISALVSLIDAAVGNNTIAIIISAPFAKAVAVKQNIAPKRLASLLDIWSCVVQGIIPHGAQILLACAISGLSPVDVIGHGYYPLLLAVVTAATTVFGLLKTKEEKEGIPCYPKQETEKI